MGLVYWAEGILQSVQKDKLLAVFRDFNIFFYVIHYKTSIQFLHNFLDDVGTLGKKLWANSKIKIFLQIL